MKIFSHRKRPVHLGPYPLERLPRAPLGTSNDPHLAGERPLPARPCELDAGPESALHAYKRYIELFDQQRHGEVAPVAPIPDDPAERAANLKAGLYFLDADMAGCTKVPPRAWLTKEASDQHFGVVVLVAHTRPQAGDYPGRKWIDGTRQVNADLRASEIASITANYVRNLGFEATAHTPSSTDVDLDYLALHAGLVEVHANTLRSPYLRHGFALAAVTTTMAVEQDLPLARRRWAQRGHLSRWLKWMVGWGGTRAGIARLNGDHRPLHQGSYPMERIKRVNEPTTLILADEISRVPVRAGGFPRAANGDLGPKFENDVKVFAFKTPAAQAYVRQIQAMTPHQDGPVASDIAPETKGDPAANSDGLKALAYHLGADMVGVCQIPDYGWYSHRGDGSIVEPYHSNAVVILLDQGYETMQGASGDDWISGAQSMRAYMRGAQIAGIMAEHVRSLGYSARSQTNRDSDVLHIPLVLHAGLGEMSRIGELVLNPFVGPRFKSVVMTTDMPLKADKPIDFGLQDFCHKCTKCARECPCAAIPFGDKIMFNGYETWKPDVEKCTKYRLGNLKGSACGRCMKTCPYNIEGVMAERLVLWSAIKVPATRRWIARLDDKVGNGAIKPVKKWWWDLEFVGGKSQLPSKGTNARGLDPQGGRVAARQKIGLYTPDLLPPGDAIGTPVKMVRSEALAKAEIAESPTAARARVAHQRRSPSK